jgi:hypothetical protein
MPKAVQNAPKLVITSPTFCVSLRVNIAQLKQICSNRVWLRALFLALKINRIKSVFLVTSPYPREARSTRHLTIIASSTSVTAPFFEKQEGLLCDMSPKNTRIGW